MLVYRDKVHYNPSKQTLHTWMAIKLHWYLKEVYYRGRHPGSPELREPHATQVEIPASDKLEAWERGEMTHMPEGLKCHQSKINRLLQEIGEEGAALIRILAEAGEDLIAQIQPCKGRTPAKKQANLKAYLVDVMDWEINRVNRAFREVLECL